jgi:hypothetical protein
MFRKNMSPSSSGLNSKASKKPAGSRQQAKLPVSGWFLVWLTFQPWRCGRYIPPKRRLTFNGLHGVLFQIMEPYIFPPTSWSKCIRWGVIWLTSPTCMLAYMSIKLDRVTSGINRFYWPGLNSIPSSPHPPCSVNLSVTVFAIYLYAPVDSSSYRLRPWRWRQNAPPKRRYPTRSTRLHGIKIQNNRI